MKARLLDGKRGLVVGVASDRSIARGCARADRAPGAEVAMTRGDEKALKWVEPLAKEVEAPIFMPMDVTAPGETEAVFERIAQTSGGMGFLVRSIAFSPKETLQRRVVEADRAGFLTTMEISAWSFLRMAHRAEPLMKQGGAIFTMTCHGSTAVVENDNVMGVAKGARDSRETAFATC